MDKQIVFDYARHEINEDVRMFYKVNVSKRYIFYNSKRHCVGDCLETDILKWIEERK